MRALRQIAFGAIAGFLVAIPMLVIAQQGSWTFQNNGQSLTTATPAGTFAVTVNQTGPGKAINIVGGGQVDNFTITGTCSGCTGTGAGITGTPAAGNLTKFSGTSAITNGDLTGDVTTSGSLATSIAAGHVMNAMLAGSIALSKLSATLSGSTTVLGTTSGILTSGHCVTLDASGNLIDAGAACGTGGAGTVTHTGGALTSNLPMFGNGGNDSKVGSISGNTTIVASTTGTLTSGDCVKIDTFGNFIDNGSTCGGGASAPGTTNDVPFNNGSGFGADTGSFIYVVGSHTLTTPLLSANGFFEARAAKTANYTLTSNDSLVTGDVSGGTFTLTLPTAVGISGRQYTLKKIDSSTTVLTVGTTSAQTIDGASTQALIAQGCVITVESNGSNWDVKSGTCPAFADPGADSFIYFQNSTKRVATGTIGTGLSLTSGTLSATGSGTLGTTTYYVCAKGSGGTCVYNGDAGTVATPSDSNNCTAKATPCATLAGVATLLSGKYIAGIVTIQLATTAGTGSDCYQPNGVVFDSPTVGGGFPYFPVTISAATDVYPTAYIYVQGDTTTRTNVKMNGGGSCTSTTSSAGNAIFFKHNAGRVRGVEIDYYKFGEVSCVSSASCWLEDITSTSDNPANGLGYVGEAYYGSHLAIGGTWTVTNEGFLNIAGGSTGRMHTPLGYPTATVSISSTTGAITVQEQSHLMIDGGTFTFSGAGSYNMLGAANDASISFNGDVSTTFTFNAANATEMFAQNGGRIDEGCGSTFTTCTFTALKVRANAQAGSTIVYGPTLTLGSSANNSSGNGCISTMASFPMQVAQTCAMNLGAITSTGNATFTGSTADAVNIFVPDGGQNRFTLTSSGASTFLGPVVKGQRSEGTLASKSVVANGDWLFALDGCGWDTSIYGCGGQILFLADGTYSTSSHPTRLEFQVTPSGSTTTATKATLSSAGNWDAASFSVGGTSGQSFTCSTTQGITVTSGLVTAHTCTAPEDSPAALHAEINDLRQQNSNLENRLQAIEDIFKARALADQGIFPASVLKGGR